MTGARPRLGLDARLRAYRPGGIAEHVARLLEGLAELAPPEEILVLAHRREAPGARPAGFPARRLWTPPHHRLEGRALPLELARLGLDLLHSPDVVLPAGWRGAGVATVHDLAFLRRPELLTAASLRYYRGVHGSVRRADRVIVVSEHTRRELLALTDVDPAKVAVIPNAVPARFRAPPEPASDRAVAARHGLDGPFLLFVSTIEPRKNLGVLLAAFRRLLDEGRPLTLALAGADGWRSAPVYQRARELGLGERARFLGHVPEPELPALLRQAAVLAHPALDEGFGLAPLEAMAAGTPVVAARAGSLPELVGEAGLLVPPGEPAAWAEALAAVLDSPGLAGRLAALGRARAAAFTPARMAAATLAVYRAALAGQAERAPR